MKKSLLTICAGLFLIFSLSGQDNAGSISPEMLQQIKQSYKEFTYTFNN